MKKFYLFLVLLTGLVLVGCDKSKESVQTDDDFDICSVMEDVEFKAYCLENFDTNNDGKLSLTEGEKIANIDIQQSSKGTITSLKGIEYFMNLEALLCSSNLITSLDVSKNTALTKLECSGNLLTSLDVSGCTTLNTLYCSSNHLASLDVSNCTALSNLYCSSNQLTSLDVSGCTALTKLECGSNLLTALDVNGCTALKALDCHSNRLTSLDVSNNTALVLLYCSENFLSSLDVSKNSALIELSCAYNGFSSLDVSNNMALRVLSFTFPGEGGSADSEYSFSEITTLYLNSGQNNLNFGSCSSVDCLKEEYGINVIYK